MTFGDSASSDPTNLSSFTGSYELVANKNYLPTDDLMHLEEEMANSNLHYILTEKVLNPDSIGRIIVDVKSFDKKYLSFTFRANKDQIDFLIVKGKMKDNGFFYLDQKTFECVGLPFIIGGCYNCKTRIGLSEDQGLLINKAISNKGALLLVLPSGNSFNLAYNFKRIS